MDLFTIKKCFNCPNRVVDLEKLESKLRQVITDKGFNSRLASRVEDEKPLHHQMFHIALAGCPNSCNQPQIKDFGVQGQMVPEVTGDCKQCEACIETCPEGAISLGRRGIVIDSGKCLNCGMCIRVCPTGSITGEKAGFRVLAGGKLGRHPRLAEELIPIAGEDHVADALARSLEFFLQEAKPGERFGSLLERTGWDKNFK
jgi:dissimilatory sulfite reductase (desulfoviridin) alpha/beta subunit